MSPPHFALKGAGLSPIKEGDNQQWGNWYIKTEKIMELNYVLDPAVLAGTKIIYANKSGTATGKINGKILSIGGDFGTLVAPATFKLNVRGVIQTEDSATII